MGCMSSRNVEFPNDVHPNIFTVATVNRNNAKSVYGQLEVTSADLVLHRRGHDPVCWPLHYVRRYGFENNIFSFESGRRCESGPGIFTFRCRRAQELFFLVQTCIQEQRTEGGATGDGYVPARRFSNRPHSVNEYLTTENGTANFVPNPLMTESFTGQLLIDDDAQYIPNLDINGATADAESVSQVFMEITPLSATYRTQPTRHRSIALSSNGSSSGLGQSSASRPRPHSVEIVTTPTSGSAMYCNSSALISPSPPLPIIPMSPPGAYYVNVNPQPQIDDIKVESKFNQPMVNHAPTDGFKSAANTSNTFQCKVHQRPQSVSSDGSQTTYNSSNAHNVQNRDGGRNLNYVLLEVKSGSNIPATPHSTNSSSSSVNNVVLAQWPIVRARRFSNQSSSGALFHGNGYDSGNESTTNTFMSNYAKIDCTKTKALHETTAHRIGADDSFTGSSSRRTRHDSTIDGGKRNFD